MDLLSQVRRLRDYDEAIRYFRGAARYKHPSYIDRLIAHAYRKKGDIEAEYKQWQHCLTIFQNDSYHIDITDKHLRKAQEKLINK
jgi:tetratricopeptide (TPR) repeat protein